MDRQRCVINAIIKQANPANMLARYEDIAKAGKTIVYTDMPQEVLPLMVDLSLRVKDGNVRSIVFKHGVDGFLSPNPDFAQMRKRVKVALGETKVRQARKKTKHRRNRAPPRAKTSTTPARTTRRWRRPRSPIADRPVGNRLTRADSRGRRRAVGAPRRSGPRTSGRPGCAD